jgi:futalosine hydrolase
MSHILIAAAVTEELEELINRLAPKGNRTIGHRSISEGLLGGRSVRIIETGPGMVNTAQAVTAAIEELCPKLIIQTGCAGAFSQAGLGIGDIGIATMETDVHVGLESAYGQQGLGPLPFPLLPSQPETAKGLYPFDQRLVESVRQIISGHLGSKRIKVGKGPFVTVSTVTATDASAQHLYERYHACMEAMEGSAAAHVAAIYGIPFLEIRAASNLVGNRDRNSWDTGLAFQRAAEAVWAVASGPDVLSLA